MISKGRIFTGVMLLLGPSLWIISSLAEYIDSSINLSWLGLLGRIMMGIGLVGYLFFVMRKRENPHRAIGNEKSKSNTDITQQ